MERDEREVVHMELKYCERCGGLWLRLKGSDAVFCYGCAKAMAGVPVPTPPSPCGGQQRLGDEVRVAFWTEGGTA